MVVIATSPRSAQRRCAFLSFSNDWHPADTPSEDSDVIDDRAETAEKDNGATCGSGDGERVWCNDCEMWLNGPTQWQDHKIGSTS